jgi:hypothetical protein
MWQHSPDQFSICQDVEGIACALAMQMHIISKAIEEIQNKHAPLFRVESDMYVSNGLRKEAEKQAINREKKSKAAGVRWSAEQKQCTSNADASFVQCSLIPSPIPSSSPTKDIKKEEVSGVPAGASTKPKREVFTPPTLEQCKAYAIEIELPESEADLFFDSKTANGWLVGKAKMKCWKSGMRYWKGQSKKFANSGSSKEKKERPIWHECERRCNHWDTEKRWCSKYEKTEPTNCDSCWSFNH